ncbi:peptidoglycan DD-metalloendopeptidase family protein [Caenimonas sp. SL110]|uniref:peptidoglycan DD-metalloendopeptidase family protein n=1 Tax=Caenimonas sp. SL110 TaxID=1450524 RepID=UPI001EE6DAD1|nr:peptidoglycan DD-metalloendopeptidase family protein [Caenimonas sp. SL110]
MAIVVVGVLAGCASSSRAPAPVEDRSAIRHSTAPAQVEVRPAVTGSDNAGKPGYYTVRSGDTLIRIALETGQNWRDIARWNNIENANLIEVGQVLRVVAPVAVITESSGVVTRPVVQGSAVAVAAGSAASAPRAAASAQVATAPAAPAPSAAPASAGEDDVAWGWPTTGSVVAGFDEQRNKGLDIAGKPGDPVLATADGRVVYAGAGLRGYGNLIILKHNNTFLSAYAHNQALLVKEDQAVRKGQKIAEMGSSDSDRVKLHFEIRRQGKPVDPAKYLPPR